MPKAEDITDQSGKISGVMIYCPGCKTHHVFDDRWTFNGDYEKPTFSPSMLVNKSFPDSRCHSFVRDGKIEFLSDCAHELKSQTVELPEIEDNNLASQAERA